MDLRPANQRFTLKERPMVRADLDDFVARYASGERRKRKEVERFHRFPYCAVHEVHNKRPAPATQ
jgi:type I restriction enzyme M protein